MNFAFRFLNLDPLYNILIDVNATIPVTNFNYLFEHFLYLVIFIFQIMFVSILDLALTLHLSESIT